MRTDSFSLQKAQRTVWQTDRHLDALHQPSKEKTLNSRPEENNENNKKKKHWHKSYIGLLHGLNK